MTDTTFGTSELILPRKEDEDNEAEELSKAIRFTEDSQQLFYVRVGYEWILGYGFYDITTRADRFITLPDMQAQFFSDDCLLVSNVYENIFQGYIDLGDPDDELIAIDGLPKDAAYEVSSSIKSEFIGYIHVKEDRVQARVYNGKGALVNEKWFDDQELGGNITIVPGKDTAVITLPETEHRYNNFYIWKFRQNNT